MGASNLMTQIREFRWPREQIDATPPLSTSTSCLRRGAAPTSFPPPTSLSRCAPARDSTANAQKRQIVAAVFGKDTPAIKNAIDAMESFVRDQLGDARQFSLDSPESRTGRLAALRKL